MTGWHLDKRIGISHIVTTMMMIAALFAWSGDIDKRIALLEQNDKRQDETQNRQQEELRAHLNKISKKIDKLIERELNRK